MSANIPLLISVFLIALLYAAVGHGGASGYLAVMSLLAVQPNEMATTALMLNLVVASIAVWSFARAGHLRMPLAWPFLAGSVPAAWIGGWMHFSAPIYRVLLAMVLVVAAARLAMKWSPVAEGSLKPPPRSALALSIGGGIGWLSGAVGVGGGIFLSPLLMGLRWATARQTAAVSAVFVLVNSMAGLLGRMAGSRLEYGSTWPLLIAATAGGMAGAHLGARNLSEAWLRKALALVLMIAAGKLMFTLGK